MSSHAARIARSAVVSRPRRRASACSRRPPGCLRSADSRARRSRPSPPRQASRPRPSTPAFRNKRTLLGELIRAAVRGSDSSPVPLQAGPRAVAAATDQRRPAAAFAADISSRLERVGPLVEVLSTAARSEPELAALLAKIHGERLENLRTFVAALAANGPLRARVGRGARHGLGARQSGSPPLADADTGLDARAAIATGSRRVSRRCSCDTDELPRRVASDRQNTAPTIPGGVMAIATSRKLFVNLGVRDLEASIAFFRRLGFVFDPRFTDASATCMILSEEAFVMLLVEDRFKEFTSKSLCDAGTHTEAILAVLGRQQGAGRRARSTWHWTPAAAPPASRWITASCTGAASMTRTATCGRSSGWIRTHCSTRPKRAAAPS